MAEVLALLVTVPGIAAMGVALIAGALGGVGLATLHRSALRPWRRALITTAVVVWLGALYFVSLMVATLATGRPVPVVVWALAAVWLLFCGGVLAGSYTAFRLRSR